MNSPTPKDYELKREGILKVLKIAGKEHSGAPLLERTYGMHEGFKLRKRYVATKLFMRKAVYSEDFIIIPDRMSYRKFADSLSQSEILTVEERLARLLQDSINI